MAGVQADPTWARDFLSADCEPAEASEMHYMTARNGATAKSGVLAAAPLRHFQAEPEFVASDAQPLQSLRHLPGATILIS
jgi:hypothetical protein